MFLLVLGSNFREIDMDLAIDNPTSMEKINNYTKNKSPTVDICAKIEIEVYFGGSEPLLNWELLKKVVRYCLNSLGSQFEFTFSTNTNLGLVDAAKAKFLGKYKFMVTTSLDGPAQVNDKVRRLASGAGTYQQIINGWDNIAKYYQKVEWFCLTITEDNIDGINDDFFDFLAKRGIKSCSFEPDIINPLSRDPGEIVGALLKFKKMGSERGITVGGMWDKPTKNLFEPNVRKRMFDCSAFVGRGISVSPSGDILLCSYSGTKIGKINELDQLFQSEKFRSCILSRAIGNIEACKGCEIEGQCLGGCFITSEYGQYVKSDNAFQYRCEIYRQATRALLEEALT